MIEDFEKSEAGDTEVRLAFPAFVHGQWCANRNTSGEFWRVSHVPTGRAIPQIFASVDNARACAAELPPCETRAEVTAAKDQILAIADKWSAIDDDDAMSEVVL